MAHGKTIEMLNFSNMLRWRKTPLRGKVERDRSLAGKAARKQS